MTTPTSYGALAAYARLSRKADGTLESTELQKEVMAAHAARNGNTITAWFEDPDLSAWDETVNRPGSGSVPKGPGQREPRRSDELPL